MPSTEGRGRYLIILGGENMQGFTIIDLIILVVYLAAVLFAGLHFAKKEMKGKEYFKGDGTVPWWVTSVSIFATLLSPISFLSLAGNSYAGTWIMWFAQLGMLLAIPLTIRFFLPIYSKLDIDTAYHYLELRFGSKGLRVLGAVMFIIYQVGRMSIIMYLPCMVLGSLTGINVNLLIIIMGVIAIIYSYTGGLKSVLWTDFIQGSVLLIGVTFSLVFLLDFKRQRIYYDRRRRLQHHGFLRIQPGYRTAFYHNNRYQKAE